MNNSPIYDRIERDLKNRAESDLLRQIQPYSERDVINLATNSYLALHENKALVQNAKKLAGEQYFGNLASRLVIDNSPLHEIIEKELSEWEQTEASLVFQSGYAANVGIIQAICTRETEVYCDRLNHASIYDGIALSGCKLIRYRHNDMSDLKARLWVSTAKEKMIITDTVFSMDGDCAPLMDICELAQDHNCLVMADEAHATGIFGSRGTGLVEATGTSSAVDIRMGTFSKALASLGGYFTGSKVLRDYFVNFSRSLIYSTALSHHVLAFTLSAIRYIKENPQLGMSLLHQAALFRKRIQSAGYSTMASTTQIIPCLVASKSEALKLHVFLKERGINAPAIRPPTVPEGTARIRISFHSGLSSPQQDYVIEQLTEWKLNNG